MRRAHLLTSVLLIAGLIVAGGTEFGFAQSRGNKGPSQPGGSGNAPMTAVVQCYPTTNAYKPRCEKPGQPTTQQCYCQTVTRKGKSGVVEYLTCSSQVPLRGNYISLHNSNCSSINSIKVVH